MRSRWLALCLLVAWCAAKPEPAVISPVVEMPSPVVHHAPSMPVPPVPSASELTPAQIFAAARQSRIDATGYVAWENSKPENIDRLAILVATLDTAVANMRAHKTAGKYLSPDVLAARGALRELRSFLSNKGD